MARLVEHAGTATTTEDSVDVNCDVEALLNDGDDDIIFGIDASTSSTFTRRVKPGEQYDVARFPVRIRTLYFRAVSGSQAFRFWGVRN